MPYGFEGAIYWLLAKPKSGIILAGLRIGNIGIWNYNYNIIDMQKHHHPSSFHCL
jgi:hypothetical protein